jgi:hypothetical protein
MEEVCLPSGFVVQGARFVCVGVALSFVRCRNTDPTLAMLPFLICPGSLTRLKVDGYVGCTSGSVFFWFSG